MGFRRPRSAHSRQGAIVRRGCVKAFSLFRIFRISYYALPTFLSWRLAAGTMCVGVCVCVCSVELCLSGGRMFRRSHDRRRSQLLLGCSL
ncbi:uncharacterized protein LY79DRAFT_566623 [Colletotrichum navitas]|uniref:Uncharacterized protein n=1 Tax=Colletotrichum navitas TaxID=681940 RepID=A0AAD8PR17_9PEZI|nr:uncharacterized protein LY79DRAFT_566623 [Colletotrichum navitas]KAK1574174.1 hypothetical protein LY79DRAFT_566623 [Colletotrichum navitas]